MEIWVLKHTNGLVEKGWEAHPYVFLRLYLTHKAGQSWPTKHSFLLLWYIFKWRKSNSLSHWFFYFSINQWNPLTSRSTLPISSAHLFSHIFPSFPFTFLNAVWTTTLFWLAEFLRFNFVIQMRTILKMDRNENKINV